MGPIEAGPPIAAAAKGTKSKLTTFLKWRRYTRASAVGRNARGKSKLSAEDEGQNGLFVLRKGEKGSADGFAVPERGA